METSLEWAMQWGLGLQLRLVMRTLLTWALEPAVEGLVLPLASPRAGVPPMLAAKATELDAQGSTSVSAIDAAARAMDLLWARLLAEITRILSCLPDLPLLPARVRRPGGGDRRYRLCA